MIAPADPNYGCGGVSRRAATHPVITSWFPGSRFDKQGNHMKKNSPSFCQEMAESKLQDAASGLERHLDSGNPYRDEDHFAFSTHTKALHAIALLRKTGQRVRYFANICHNDIESNESRGECRECNIYL